MVREYHGDGTFTEVRKEIPVEAFMMIKETKDFEKKLQLLKKYGLVSSDASVSKYREQAQSMADKLGITPEKIDEIMKKVKSLKSSDFRFFFFNALCRVNLLVLWSMIYPTPIPLVVPTGILLPVGFSSITSLIALLSFFIKPERIPTADLAVMGLGIGMVYTEGYFGRQGSGGVFASLLIGFAGIIAFACLPMYPACFTAWWLDGFSVIAAGGGPVTCRN